MVLCTLFPSNGLVNMLLQHRIIVGNSVFYSVDPRGTVQLEGLGKLKKSNDLTRKRTSDLQAMHAPL
jgi:hypothetical protein